MPKTTSNQRARNFRAQASMRARILAGAAIPAPAQAEPVSQVAKASPECAAVCWPITSGMSKKHHIAVGSSTTACGSTTPAADGLQLSGVEQVDCLRCTRQLAKG